jgi:dipeptidyl-peptidase-4
MIKKLWFLVFFISLFHLAAMSQEMDKSEIRKWLDESQIFGIEPIELTWHSSGDVCAFLWNESGQNYLDIYIYYPSGNKRERLTDSVELEIQNRLLNEDRSEKMKPKSEIKTAGISEFVFHPKKKQIYFLYGEDIYKIDINDKKPERVTRTVEEESCIKISPDGKWLSFVRTNNIWILGIEGGNEFQLTDTGSETIINGRTVYPVPGLPGEKAAYEWNGISSGLAFITTDISPVSTQMGAQRFYKALKESLIPNPFSPIPKYEVNTVFLRNFKNTKINTGEHGEYYIRKIQWRPVSLDLLVLYEDRKCKRVAYYLVNTFSGQNKLIFEEQDPKAVNLDNRFTAFSQNGTTLYLTSEEDGWNHLYSLGIKSPEKRQLTKGEWEITGIEGVDNKNNIYVTTTRIRPNQRHLEKVSPDTGLIEQVTFVEGCHKCLPSPSFSDALDFFKGNFISGDLYYFAFNRPYQRNRITSPPIPNYNNLIINEPRYVTFNNRKDGGLIFARIWSPANFNGEASPAVILLKDEYSQPSVLRSLFKKDVSPNILTGRGYYVLELDQRGTSGYGKKWRTDNYMRDQELDIEDIISGCEYLASLKEIDAKRIGVLGSGYGAYLTSLLMMKNQGPFRIAVAINPLLSWEKYDTRFVESVFGNPSTENDAYKNFELSKDAEDINSKLLIILKSDRNNDRSILINQYFQQMLSKGAHFDIKYFPAEKTSDDRLEERYRFVEEILNYLHENL